MVGGREDGCRQGNISLQSAEKALRFKYDDFVEEYSDYDGVVFRNAAV